MHICTQQSNSKGETLILLVTFVKNAMSNVSWLWHRKFWHFKGTSSSDHKKNNGLNFHHHIKHRSHTFT